MCFFQRFLNINAETTVADYSTCFFLIAKAAAIIDASIISIPTKPNAGILATVGKTALVNIAPRLPLAVAGV